MKAQLPPHLLGRLLTWLPPLQMCYAAVSCKAFKEAVAHACSQVTHLKVLETDNNPGPMIRFIKLCKGLTHVDLTHNDGLSDGFIWPLAECPRLTSVKLPFVGKYGVPAFMYLFEHCSAITNVVMDENDIDDGVLCELAKRCKGLKSCTLHRCFEFTDAGLVTLAKSCRNLTQIFLRACIQVTDTAVIALATHCTSLCKIGLEGCFSVTHRGVVALATHCPKLYWVGVTYCKVTDDSIVALGQRCKYLVHIRCDHCTLLTDRVLEELFKCGCLSHAGINCRECPGLDKFAYMSRYILRANDVQRVLSNQ